ncbi:hypothetical protein [Acetobacterium sp.]|uniref:hypothetical protein n=1 Tax=Acetobacterium sp. TaxID=1872094 RepID=UPI002F3EF98A
MENLDKLMECLGFNDRSVKDFASGIPFKSRKSDIMVKIRKVGEIAPINSNLYALFYILSIAFSVLVIRLFVLIEAKNTLLVTIFTDLVIDYSDQLIDGFRMISLLVSALICMGIYFLIHHFKNEKKFS